MNHGNDRGAQLPLLDLSRLLGSTCGSAKPCAWCGESILKDTAQLEAATEGGAVYFFHPLCISSMRRARK